MSAHVIYVVLGVGECVLVPVCWRHTEADANEVARILTEQTKRYHYAFPVSDEPIMIDPPIARASLP